MHIYYIKYEQVMSFLTLQMKLAVPIETVINAGAQIVHAAYWNEWIFAAGMYTLQIK